MVLSQGCLAVLVVAVCAAAQTPTKYTYQDTNSESRRGATNQQQSLKGQRYKHAYGNTPENSNRQPATGSLYNDNMYPMKRQVSVSQSTGYKRHVSPEYYPRRQMYDGQDIPNPNYRPSYGYPQHFLYRRQPFWYGRYGVPYNGYFSPYSGGYGYPVRPTAPSYTQGKPSGYIPSVTYGQGAPYFRDVLYLPNSNDHRKSQSPLSNNGEGKGQSSAEHSRTGGSGQTVDPTVQTRPNGNSDRNPKSPQFGRNPDPGPNRNPQPTSSVDFAALFGNNNGRHGSGASQQPSDIDINALLKSIGNNSLFAGRPLRPTSMDLGSLYARGGEIQGFQGNPSSPPDNSQQNPGGARVIYPNGGQQQAVLPKRPDVQGAPQGVQGRQVYDPYRPSALPGGGNSPVPRPGANDVASQRYPQRNGQPGNNGGIILTQEQVAQLLGQSGNVQGSPARPSNQITIPYYSPSSGQPSAQPPTRERPNVSRPAQSGNTGGNQRYPEENSQRPNMNQGIPLIPRQQEGTLPYYGPTPGQPTRIPSQPGNNRVYPQSGDPRYPQGGDQRYSQGGNPRYPQGRDPRYPQGGDPRYPQGSDLRYPQGSDSRYPQGSNQGYPQGGDPRYSQGSDLRYPQGSDSRYPQGGDQGYPRGGDPRNPQGGDLRNPQGSDPRYPQGGDQGYPQGGDPRNPQGGDPRNPQAGDLRNPQSSDPRYPQGGDQGYPQGGDPRNPQGGDPRNPQAGDPRNPQGSGQDIEGIALTPEQIQNLFGQAVPGNPRQGDNNGAFQNENPRLTPGRQPTGKNSGLPSTSDGGRTQG
ncbi:AT-rich interactive domain-containing protein 1A-like [Haliotis asinina]|uniref:AT-rich interactive domain-containing protein 1A-like n=1 Tax=Haliotis asinina TaxID=109174 RepID=UPI003532549A